MLHLADVDGDRCGLGGEGGEQGGVGLGGDVGTVGY
jgi:hypothetical protein